MGLRAMQPGKHTSKRNKDHKVFPYLFIGLRADRPNQVRQTDITYIPMKKGFMYMTTIIDVHTRYVVNWSVSNSMEAEWVTKCMQEAFDKHGRPEILNTDQGSQYTSEEFTSIVLNDNQTKLSMDGRGRATVNAYIERLWTSVKYEKIYLNPPSDGLDLYQKLQQYIEYYNKKRRHSSINDQRPSELFFKQLKEVA